jgi:DNA invertase Pin-like site-specific DNA recombinase
LKAELVVSHIPRALDEIVRGNRFQSVSEPWADNNTHADKMIVTIFAGTAGFECVLIRERTEASRVGV